MTSRRQPKPGRFRSRWECARAIFTLTAIDRGRQRGMERDESSPLSCGSRLERLSELAHFGEQPVDATSYRSYYFPFYDP